MVRFLSWLLRVFETTTPPRDFGGDPPPDWPPK